MKALQEEDLVARRLVVAVAIASLAIMGVSLAIVKWLAPPPAPAETRPALFEGRGARDRVAGRARLDALEWVDRDAGIARIPIDRAMDLVVARDGGAP